MIRVLLVVCGLLLLTNVATFFWPKQENTVTHIYPAKADINPNFLRLNKEIQDKYDANAVRVTSGTSSVVDQNPNACFRLGPFMQDEHYILAQSTLSEAEIDFQKSTREKKQSLVYRVYLGPWENKAEVDDARVNLKRKNILDHFVRKQKNNEYIISLGIYSRRKSAITAVSRFSDKLESVKLKQEQIMLPQNHWLHFSLDESNSHYRSLLSRVWGEQSAKLGKYACQQIVRQ